MRDDDCDVVVHYAWHGGRRVDVYDKVNCCFQDLSKWAKRRFGNVPKKIMDVKQELQELMGHEGEDGFMARIKLLEEGLDDLLKIKEVWWAQRSRATWLRHGDKNTKKIHLKASQRKEGNWIYELKDDFRMIVDREEHIAHVLLYFFSYLFSSSIPLDASQNYDVVRGLVTSEMMSVFEAEYTHEKVWQALKLMKSNAAPGPDGLPALFYQKVLACHW